MKKKKRPKYPSTPYLPTLGTCMHALVELSIPISRELIESIIDCSTDTNNEVSVDVNVNVNNIKLG